MYKQFSPQQEGKKKKNEVEKQFPLQQLCGSGSAFQEEDNAEKMANQGLVARTSGRGWHLFDTSTASLAT